MNNEGLLLRYLDEIRTLEEKVGFGVPMRRKGTDINLKRKNTLSGDWEEMARERRTKGNFEMNCKALLGRRDKKDEDDYFDQSEGKPNDHHVLRTEPTKEIYFDNVKELSFSNKKHQGVKQHEDLGQIDEESSKLNFSRTIIQHDDRRSSFKNYFMDKDDVIRQIEENSEAKLKVFNKFKHYRDFATNIIFSNWNINNFKTKFKNAYSAEKV